MLISRRRAPLLAFVTFGFIFLLVLRSDFGKRSWRDESRGVRPGEVVIDQIGTFERQSLEYLSRQTGSEQAWKQKPSFQPGVPPAPGHNYTKVLVVAKTRAENTDWIQEEVPGLLTAIYLVDDPSAPLHPPKNKGNEVMVYLTYVIDSYEDLPDIVMFMHAHRFSWHNNDILNYDAYEIITRLSSERVVREGYMNLRCHWNPGCPDWIHLDETTADSERAEREVVTAWSELFPVDRIPKILAQPCCGQFALSRERIQAIPKTEYIFYRDWLMRTNLQDSVSGRMWEYLWHYVFTRRNTFCPNQHVCYCDGFGVCFEDDDAFDYWYELDYRRRTIASELNIWYSNAKLVEETASSRLDGSDDLEMPKADRNVTLLQDLEDTLGELGKLRDDAIRRGNEPQNRAAIAGRQWHDGDWY